MGSQIKKQCTKKDANKIMEQKKIQEWNRDHKEITR